MICRCVLELALYCGLPISRPGKVRSCPARSGSLGRSPWPSLLRKTPFLMATTDSWGALLKMLRLVS